MRARGLVTITAIAAALSMIAVGVADAQRGRRGRRRGRRARPPAAAPQSAAIAESLGELRWGLEPRAVHEHFVGRIRERFRPQLAKAMDAISEDRLRRQEQEEVRRLRESYTRFRGTRTGWDLSFLRGEFTHNNRESMIVQRDGNSQNFYFFIQGRLWKWYKAFDASVFEGRSFEQFAEAIQGRFGPAVERRGQLVEGGPEHHWLEWQDDTTRLRAIDQTHFYGFYCLVFEDKATIARLDSLRVNSEERGQQGHSLVDAVVIDEQEGTGSESDANADVVDRITGRIRRHQQAPEGEGRSQQRRESGSSSSSRRRSGNPAADDRLDLSDL